MVAKTKIIYFVLLLWFFHLDLAVFAQEDTIKTLQKQFEQFGTQGLTEKLYVHTDKDFYTPGEVIWFKVYAVDGIFNKPLDLSKAAYIEILDRDHRPVLQGKIPMSEGSGVGSFTIPASISSGNYLLRAYTNWMKNSSPDFFFEKKLSIVNSLKKPDWASLQKKAEDYDIQFLPEGGQLVNGMECRVAIKAVDKNGKGINCSGFILDQKSDTVSYFKTLRFGMGRFSFLPLKGNDYRVYTRLEDGTIVPGQLPPIHSTGFVMKCEDHDKQLLITVTTNDQPFDSYVYLLTHTRQVMKSIKAAKISNGKADFTIDKNVLGEGISDMILFNDQLKPVCERLYFKRPGEQLQITLNTDRSGYDKRKQVSLQLQTADRSGKAVSADLSLSVYLLDSVQSYSEEDIRSYLWLSSELTGHIEAPSYYFNSTAPEAEEAADDLMMTHGWRRFSWNDVQQNKRSLPQFIPETDGSFARGKIMDKRSGLPVAEARAFLSVPGQHYFFTTAVSDSNGKVNFNINNVYGNNEIVVQPVNHGDSSNYRMDMINPFSSQYSVMKVPAFSITENFVSQLLTHSLSSQVQNAYPRKEQQRYVVTSIQDSTVFFGEPDGKYFLDDYTRFTTMEEVIREYVAEVKLRKKDGEVHFMTKNLPYTSFFDLDPLILLDGVPVMKPQEMVSFDPLKIKKLEVIARTFYTGPVAYHGIVSYSSYEGDLAGSKLPPDAIVTNYPGYLYERSFYSPVYQTEEQVQSRLPDFRNVLYWEPKLKTNEKGKQLINFYTSDLPGKYVIVAEGISKEGSCGTASGTIIVKK